MHFRKSHVCANQLHIRMDGIPALPLWDLVYEQNKWTQERATGKPVGSCQAKHA